MEILRCLIVEDEPDWQINFKRALLNRGFGVDNTKVAEDKARALVELESWAPDIVILDLSIESRQGSGDVNPSNGRAVLKRIGELNKQALFRIVVLVVSGTIDEYSQVEYESNPAVARAVNKEDVADALPGLVKKAQKLALPIHRTLKLHWPEHYSLFEKIMNEATPPGSVIQASYELSNLMLRNLGETILGNDYPMRPGEDEMYQRIEILRGPEAKRDVKEQKKVTDEIWLEGIIYQHFHTVRNYANCHRHSRLLVPTVKHRCPLAEEKDRQTIDSLEDFERAPQILRPVMVDLLSWYLPWHTTSKTLR